MVSQIAWAAIAGVSKGLQSPLSPEPKSQRDALQRPDAKLWIEAEKTEYNMLVKMNTFEIVDLPPGATELPSMFQYKLKTGDHGEVLKYKARLCARGDQQTPDKYNDTFAPTSRFAVLRVMIALATQMNLRLKHWDIKGAFLCADIDKTIYLQLPPGYAPAPGKTTKLVKSIYGLRQSSARFHRLLEAWLLAYGFTAIGADRVTFKCENCKGGIILLSLYVDDGLSATNDEVFYNKFLKDLSERFELSDC